MDTKPNYNLDELLTDADEANLHEPNEGVIIKRIEGSPPERNVYYIDVGTLPHAEAVAVLRAHQTRLEEARALAEMEPSFSDGQKVVTAAIGAVAAFIILLMLVL